MRFTIRNLFWLTLAVALPCAAIQLTGVHAIPGIVLLGGYLFAPLLLALISSFFQRVPTLVRRRIAYALLAFLALFPTCICALIEPFMGFVFGLYICAVWGVQIDIFNDLHKREATSFTNGDKPP
jgi:hypothetical protein